MFLGPIDEPKPWDTKGIDKLPAFSEEILAAAYGHGRP